MNNALLLNNTEALSTAWPVLMIMLDHSSTNEDHIHAWEAIKKRERLELLIGQ